MNKPHPNVFLILIQLLAICGCSGAVPAVLGVETIQPADLKLALEGSDKPYIIDVRSADRFEDGHIKGAVRIPPDSIYAFISRSRPAKGFNIVFVCNRGVLSAEAAVIAKGLGLTNVRSLGGGMERWNLVSLPVEKGPGIEVPPHMLKPVEIKLSWFEQLLQTLSGFAIKPVHMTLTLATIIVLWRRKDKDLSLVRTGLMAFFAGEGLCALNFFISSGTGVALDLAHDAGMIAIGTLLPWGFMMMADERFFHFFSDGQQCAAQKFCGRCWKFDESVFCGPVRIFQFLSLAAAWLSIIPLLEPLHPVNMVMPVYGTEVCYMSSIGLQFALFRVYPIAAALLFLVAFIMLLRGRTSVGRTKLPFFLGVGFATFSLFRFFLYGGYRLNSGWTLIWEETTELIAISGVAIVLWTFRRQLGIKLPWKS